MRPWLLIGIIGVVVAVGIGIVEIASGRQEPNATQSMVESTSSGISDVNLEEPNEIPYEEQIFVPEVPPDPQSMWIQDNKFDIEQNIQSNDGRLKLIGGDIESGISALNRGDFLRARSSFWSAQDKLRFSSNLISPFPSGRPPDRDCDAALTRYDSVLRSARLDWDLGSLTNRLTDIEFDASNNDDIDISQIRELEMQLMAVTGSFNRLIGSHGLAVQEVLGTCALATR